MAHSHQNSRTFGQVRFGGADQDLLWPVLLSSAVKRCREGERHNDSCVI